MFATGRASREVDGGGRGGQSVSMHRNTLDRLPELAILFHEAGDPHLVEQFLREILTPAEAQQFQAVRAGRGAMHRDPPVSGGFPW